MSDSDELSLLRQRVAELERRLTASKIDADLRAALDHLYEGVQVIDREWRYVYLNEAAERHARRKRDELIGKAMEEMYPGIEQTEVFGRLRECMTTRQPARMTTEFTYPDGRKGWFEVRAEAVPAGIMIFTIDITAHKATEEQERQSEKMEAIGRLAGGVAHDFNNLLTVINGYCELALEAIPAGAPYRAEFEEIRTAGTSAASLTRQLLAFSRKQALQPRVLDLNGVVGGMAEMLRRLIGERIELGTRLAPALAAVEFDAGQLERIIVNLVVNARDAMPDGGKLMIETANVELDDEYAKAHRDARPGPHVMIAVTDTGVGMDAETCARIFEPFFTTKGLGRGTGLGLSTVYGIVKQSGGSIWVYSEKSRGTTFKVYLSPAQKGKAASDETPKPAPARGTETILLVEDEAAVRTLIKRVLESAGYAVLDTGDPRRAVEMCSAHPGKIDLLLTDVVMPWMTGRELADRLGKLRPGLRIAFMSGYTDNAIEQQGVLEPGTRLIEKPVSPAVLLARVREYLS